MVARLVALWFTMGVMGLTAATCYSIGVDYYREYAWDGPPQLPLISRMFLTKTGWIYYYPGFFIILAAWLTWKKRDKTEWIWCFIAISLGTMLLFLTLYSIAIELPRMLAVHHSLIG